MFSRVVFCMNHLTRIFTLPRQIWLLISEIASFIAAIFIQLSKLNVLDVSINSGYDRFDDHLIQSNNISGSKLKDLSSFMRCSNN